MKVLIIEDELPQAKQLQHLISEIDPAIEVCHIIFSVSEAAALIPSANADLIFLDIQLSDGLCFEIFEKVPVACPVIFTTAYDQYAIEAFKHNGIDYLLKPVSKQELEKSISKFKAFAGPRIDYNRLADSIKSLTTSMNRFKKRFVCHAGGKIKIIASENIAYFYALGGGVFIKTFRNENFLISQTLESLQEELNPFEFFRLNRKIIAHISAIREMYPYSKSRLKIALTPEYSEDVIVSYKNKKAFMEWVKK